MTAKPPMHRMFLYYCAYLGWFIFVFADIFDVSKVKYDFNVNPLAYVFSFNLHYDVLAAAQLNIQIMKMIRISGGNIKHRPMMAIEARKFLIIYDTKT